MRDHVGLDHLLRQAAGPALFLFDLLQLRLEAGDHAVSQLAGLGEVAAALRLLQLDARVIEVFLDLLRGAELLLLLVPALAERVGGLFEIDDLLLQLGQPVLGGGVRLLLQRLALDLELHQAPVHLVELFRLGVHLHAQARRRLVHEVDGLVRQEAVGDVAVGQGRRGDQRRIGDAHAVMQLVFLFQAAQDGDGVLHRGLGHEHRLEAPGQRRVLLHMLAVLVERGGADAVQLAAGERRLEEVGGVHGAFRSAGADQGVHLVDEQDDLAVAGLDLREHGLQPLLELAAIFRAGDERAHVERQHLLVLQALRHVALDDAVRQPLDDGRLADARLADQHGVVLGAPRQNLNRTADLLVAADDGIELTLCRGLGEVAGVFLQRVVLLLGAGRIGGAAFAQIVDRFVEALRRDAGIFQDARRLAFFGHGQRLERPLHGDETVPRLGRHLLGLVEHARQARRHMRLGGAGAGDLGQLGERAVGALKRRLGVAPGAADQPGGQAFGIVE